MASGQHDQPEKLLHVSRHFLCFPLKAARVLSPARLRLLHHLQRLSYWTLARAATMVGRKILDGLRKGKKDLYAVNVQYVKRYQRPNLLRALSILQSRAITWLEKALRHMLTTLQTATSSREMTRFSHYGFSRKNAWTAVRRQQST